MNNMDCMFCEEKATVMVEAVNWKLYRAVCGHCGAQGAAHRTPTAAAQEWRRVVGFEEALHDMLHGPCAGAIENTERAHLRLLEQTAHDALYGPDDIARVGNWRAWAAQQAKEAHDEPAAV